MCPNPQEVNSGLWMVMMCPGSFINCNKCYRLVGMLLVPVWGAGDAQEAPYLPPIFAVPKTALKVALIVNKYLGHSEIYKNT